MIIYKITNLVNGKVYIGQTIQKLEARWKEHCKYSRKKVSAISAAIQKYSKDTFTVECIDTAVSIEELNSKEQKYIQQYSSIAPTGYNLNSGGLNYIDSNETREKKRLGGLGKKHTEQRKANISKSKVGIPVAELSKYAQKLGRHLNNLCAVTGKGVRYCKRDNAYQAFIYIDSKMMSKHFSCSVHGNSAMELATKYRMYLEELATEYYNSKIEEINNG